MRIDCFRHEMALFGFVMIALLAGSVCAAQEAPKDALENDPRLDRVVSLRAVGVETSALLRTLSSEKLFLRASRSCAAQKLQIKIAKRPLRVLMQSLAELLPGAWEADKDKSGYVLIMDAKAVTRRARWQRLFEEKQASAREAQRQALLKALRTEPRPGDFSNSDPQNPGYGARVRDNLSFFRALTPGMQENISRAMDDTGEYLGVYSNSILPENAVHARLSELPADAQTILRQRFAALSPVGPHLGSDPDICFQFVRHSLSISVSAENGRLRGDPGLPEMIFGIGQYTPGLGLDDSFQRAVKKLGKKAPHEWIELAAFENSRVWPNTLPPPSNAIYLPPQNRADLLQWLADKADFEYVADYYARPSVLLDDAKRKRELQKPLSVELNIMARDHDLSWKQTAGQIYLFRNNRWYRDDLTEAPGDLLTEWMTRLQTQNEEGRKKKVHLKSLNWKLQMDLDSEIVAKLNRWQIGRGLMGYVIESQKPDASGAMQYQMAFPFSQMGPRLFNENGLLTFYAELTEDQRAALASGALAAASLTPAQQETFSRIAPGLVSQISDALPYIGVEWGNAPSFFVTSPQGTLDNRPALRLLLLAPPAEK